MYMVIYQQYGPVAENTQQIDVQLYFTYPATEREWYIACLDTVSRL